MRSTLAGVESDLDAARERAEAEAAGARAAREELRAAREELRRVERERRTLAERVEGLEREPSRRRRSAGPGTRPPPSSAGSPAGRPSYRPGCPSRSGTTGPCAAPPGRSTRWPRRSGRWSATSTPCGGPPAWRTRAVGAGDPEGRGERRGRGRPRRRSPLAVPGGRGADDPETLAAWMGVDGVLVLVDGYNVTKHPQGFPDRGLEDQRTLLLDLCRRLARRFGAEVTVVFDGGTVGPIPTRLPLGPVEVVFTDAGYRRRRRDRGQDQRAPPERPVVVTSDNELRARVTALGATITRSPPSWASPPPERRGGGAGPGQRWARPRRRGRCRCGGGRRPGAGGRGWCVEGGLEVGVEVGDGVGGVGAEADDPGVAFAQEELDQAVPALVAAGAVVAADAVAPRVPCQRSLSGCRRGPAPSRSTVSGV